MPVDLWALPRGMKRDGLTPPNTLRWTSKHGSVVVASGGASDGLNEQGLAAHLLWLSESEYGPRDSRKAGLSVGMWIQYCLDNFASVKEVIDALASDAIQLVPGPLDGQTVTVHLALEDRSGDSAVIEFIDGRPNIHHGREFVVLTNSPPYEQQLVELRRYRGFGGKKPLPGTTEAADRFVRAAYYLEHLPPPATYREAIAGILSVMRNVAQPFGTEDPARPNVSATRWRTTADLTNLRYYFESITSPNLVWVNLPQLELWQGAPVRKLNLQHHPDRVGDVTDDFLPAVPFSLMPKAA